jgi:geranylgeranyl diphosphate synthase type II
MTISKASRSEPVRRALVEPLRKSLTSSGKRVRGILTLAAGEAAGGRAEKLVEAAAAMEMIHACSLILDDLPSMDDAVMRRGAPALHREFGEDLAILTAVSLLNHAYGLVAKNHAALNPRQWPMQQVMKRVVDAVGWDGTIAGQAVDLHSEGSKLDFDTLEFIHSRKTGALFVAAAAVGGMLANISAAALSRIEVFAKNLGLAFQITDDILGVTGEAEQPRQGCAEGRAAADVREARGRRRRAQAQSGAGRYVARIDRESRRGGSRCGSWRPWFATASGEGE